MCIPNWPEPESDLLPDESALHTDTMATCCTDPSPTDGSECEASFCLEEPCYEPCVQEVSKIDICSICDPSLMSGSMNDLSLDLATNITSACGFLNEPSCTHQNSHQDQQPQLTVSSPNCHQHNSPLSSLSSSSSICSSPCSLDCCKDCETSPKAVTEPTRNSYSELPTISSLLNCSECDSVDPCNSYMPSSFPCDNCSFNSKKGDLNKLENTNDATNETNYYNANLNPSEPFKFQKAKEAPTAPSSASFKNPTSSFLFSELPSRIGGQSCGPSSPQTAKRIKGIPPLHNPRRHIHHHCHSHPVHLPHSATGCSITSPRHSHSHHHHHHIHNHRHEQYKHNHKSHAPGFCSLFSNTTESSNNSATSSSALSSRSNSIASSATLPLGALLDSQDNISKEEQAPARFYCHWGDKCEEVAFNNETDFDMHLRSIHLNLDNNTSLKNAPVQDEDESVANKRTYDEYFPENPDDKYLQCNWDQCNAELAEFDDILEHIKVNHSVSSREYPHSLCSGHIQNLMPLNTTNTNIPPPLADVQSPVVQQYTPPESNINTPTPAQILQCAWANCGFNTNDVNSMESHEFMHHPEAIAAQKNGVSLFQCEWKSCSYQCADLNEFMSHVRHDHVVTSMFSKPQVKIPVNPIEELQDEQEPEPEGQKEQKLLNSLGPDMETSVPLSLSPVEGSILQKIEPVTDLNTKFAIKTESVELPSTPQLVPEENQHICRWVCDGHECGKVFDSTQSLNQHVVDLHIGSRKNEYVCHWAGCERGGRPFAQRQKIHRHLITHTKNKPFVCEVCGNAFSEVLVLKQHMRVHSGEKPFECKICSKRFAASTALSVHMRTHTGEKPLACKWPGCEKRFSESSNLAKHMKSKFSPILCFLITIFIHF